MPPENLFQVGEYIEMFNEVTGQDLPCGPIYQSHGLQAHVQKRHPSDISHLSCVPLIISAPDYIGKHPKEPNSSWLSRCNQEKKGKAQSRRNRRLCQEMFVE